MNPARLVVRVGRAKAQLSRCGDQLSGARPLGAHQGAHPSGQLPRVSLPRLGGGAAPQQEGDAGRLKRKDPPQGQEEALCQLVGVQSAADRTPQQSTLPPDSPGL